MGDRERTGDAGLLTVVVALTANALVAAAKTTAAALTGSASMVAEAAHSWADTGNELFLLAAERRGGRPADASHPRGHGRETYVWSMFAAVGLLVAGGALSVWHGVTQLTAGPEEAPRYAVNWVVLAMAFVFEGISFAQAARQAHGRGKALGLRPMRYVFRTSDATLRAVFLEDLAALGGLLVAGLGIGLHQATGHSVWDALGAIAVGLLLGAVAIVLIVRNHDFLVGETIPAAMWNETLSRLLHHPEVERVTYLHIEYVGPMRFFVVAAVDLVGDENESSVAVRLRRLEAEIERLEPVADAVLTLSTPDEQSLAGPASPASRERQELRKT
ncbi:MAG: cation diffusion facilitator family transporter [Propionibacteriales bacterium]|nr:cation diffusion facilitator family transporter [Propionibacteriales bacterium]